MSTLMAGFDTRKITRDELALIPAPEATPTHQPIRHEDFASEIEGGLSMRGIRVVSQEYAVSHDGMKCFGMIVTNQEFGGVNYAIGLRNSNDKSMKIGMVSGYRVLVCSNLAFAGDFTPLMAKHTSRFSLQDAVALGVDRAHRGMRSVDDQIRLLQGHEVGDVVAREFIYDAFVPKSGMRLPKQLMDTVHREYFEPEVEEFQPRTAWSLANAFTAAFKDLRPVRQFEEMGKFTPFLLRRLGLN